MKKFARIYIGNEYIFRNLSSSDSDYDETSVSTVIFESDSASFSNNNNTYHYNKEFTPVKLIDFTFDKQPSHPVHFSETENDTLIFG